MHSLRPTGRTLIISNIHNMLEVGHVYRILSDDGNTIVFEEFTDFEIAGSMLSYEKINGFHVDFSNNTVTSPSGEIIDVSATLWKLITLFVNHRGRSLSHETILINVWGPAYRGDTQYLRVWVAKLRRLFNSLEGSSIGGPGQPNRGGQSIFRNIQGIGYCLEPEP